MHPLCFLISTKSGRSRAFRLVLRAEMKQEVVLTTRKVRPAMQT